MKLLVLVVVLCAAVTWALPTTAFARIEYYNSYSKQIKSIDRMTVVDLKTGAITPLMEIFAYGSEDEVTSYSRSVLDSKGVYYYSPYYFAINRVDLNGKSILPSIGVNLGGIRDFFFDTARQRVLVIGSLTSEGDGSILYQIPTAEAEEPLIWNDQLDLASFYDVGAVDSANQIFYWIDSKATTLSAVDVSIPNQKSTSISLTNCGYFTTDQLIYDSTRQKLILISTASVPKGYATVFSTINLKTGNCTPVVADHYSYLIGPYSASWTYDENTQYFYGVLNAPIFTLPSLEPRILTVDGRSGALLSTVNITMPVSVLSLDLIFD